MSSQSTQDTVQEMLRRKSWQQAKMLKAGEADESTISRIMRRLHSPQVTTYNEMMEVLGTPTESLYSPRLEDATMDMLALYEGIRFELERAYFYPPALENAKEWLEELRKTDNFNEGLNLQHYLGCQLRINTLEKKDPAEIAIKALAGLRITYPEFVPECYMGEVLVAGEPQLLHIYARALAASQPTQAITILQHTIEGIERTPQDELTKEKYLAPLLLDLVKILAAENHKEEALTLCDKGNDLSLRRNKGKYNPDFTFEKVKLTKNTALLLPVYCGYIALGRKTDAAKVKAFADEMTYTFPDYGLENIPYEIPGYNLERGKYTKCKFPGEFVWLFRTEANVVLTELCNGICPPSILSRIESGELNGTVYQLEALMQRLGRYMDYYFDNYLNVETFEDTEMRNEIRTRLVTRKYDNAEALLNTLKQKKVYKKGLGKQFVLYSESSLRAGRGKSDEKQFALLMEAWNITRKDIGIEEAHNFRLTNMEITLLNQMANYLCTNKESERGIRILENLRRNLIYYYVDELERLRTYTMIMSNLILHLNRAKKYEKALDMIPEVEKLCLRFGDLRQIYKVAGNRASAFVRLGKGDLYKPYMAISYYIADLLGFEKEKRGCCKTTKVVSNSSLFFCRGGVKGRKSS